MGIWRTHGRGRGADRADGTHDLLYLVFYTNHHNIFHFFIALLPFFLCLTSFIAQLIIAIRQANLPPDESIR